VVEESPCPAIDDDIVRRMGETAVQGAKAVGYFSAGTFEFLLSEDNSFYFLEMNTRLQVEHPITELCTGFDLVREMVRIADGEALGFAQEAIQRQGAAIECRIYAEDPATGFLPSPGTITRLRVPAGPGVRDDSGAYEGCIISPNYDPLISKLSVWAPTRAQAIMRMDRALAEYVVGGIRTNLPFHQRLMKHPEFIAGRYDTSFIDRHKDQLLKGSIVSAEDRAAFAAAVALATHKSDRARRRKSTEQQSSGLSPWLASHRARLR
jgi:acetyl-CoA carboxylase biotin carboxylase subunit